MPKRLAFNNAILSSFVFVIFAYILFVLLRIILIIFVNVEVLWNDEILAAILNAMRYDGQIIGVMGVLFFFLSLIHAKAARIYAFIVIIVSVFTGIANLGFYQIYGDVFNATLLGLIFDDRRAIFQTALSGDFNITIKIFAWLVLSVVFYLVFKFIFVRLAAVKFARNYAISGILFVIFAFCMLFAINGAFSLRGVSLGGSIIPVKNDLLRKITTGAYRDLGYVYKSYKRISHSKFSDYIDESPLQATRVYFNLDDNNAEYDLSKLLQREVSTPPPQRNKAYFLYYCREYEPMAF